MLRWALGLAVFLALTGMVQAQTLPTPLGPSGRFFNAPLGPGNGVVLGPGAGGGSIAPPTSAPSVASLSPTSGPIAGGTAVTIIGTQFGGATAVAFGATAAASFIVVSATVINAVSPAHAAGAVDVRVTNSFGQSPINSPADQFTFVAGCSPDGKTDWSNACDIPLGVALGVF